MSPVGLVHATAAHAAGHFLLFFGRVDLAVVITCELISRGDAFANAFVVAHTTVDLLFLELRRLPRREGAGPPTGSGS